MQIIVLTDDALHEELGSCDHPLTLIRHPEEFTAYPQANVFIDLLFHADQGRIALLNSLLPRTIIVNSVETTLQQIGQPFTRVCAWPTLLQGPLVEASAAPDQQEKAALAFAAFGKKVEWVPDQAGFITPRIISMIINEAFLAKEEGVSTEEEIDTAMKLGTNYPYGPFEWARRIGQDRVHGLLRLLSREEKRYAPAAGLSG